MRKRSERKGTAIGRATAKPSGVSEKFLNNEYSKSNFIKTKKASRDIEKAYSKAEFIKKLRRFADALESRKGISIQVAGEKISVPKDAVINIEHERGRKEEEIEFQIKWKI